MLETLTVTVVSDPHDDDVPALGPRRPRAELLPTFDAPLPITVTLAAPVEATFERTTDEMLTPSKLTASVTVPLPLTS